MLLQLALDVVDLGQALDLASATAEYVDIFEAGTPLIKQEGLRSVALLREMFPGKRIAADMKTADAGALELRLAASAGADLTSVLALSPDETITSALSEARKTGKIEVMADMIGVGDTMGRAKELSELGVDYILVHCGLDQQAAGRNPFTELARLAKLAETRLAVAGGVNSRNIDNIMSIPNLAIVIVGGAITSAPDPCAAARQIRLQLDRG